MLKSARFLAVTLFAGSALLAAEARGDTIANFNFNSPPATNTAATTGVGTINFAGFGGGIADNTGTTINALPGDIAGRDLTLTAGAGLAGNNTFIDFNFSTLLLEDITLSFARQRSGTGFTSNAFSFSTDAGLTFTPVATQTSITSSFSAGSVDFSSFAGINDQTSVIVRLAFDGATGAAGNNRFDNVRFEGTVIPEPLAFGGGLVLTGIALLRRRNA